MRSTKAFSPSIRHFRTIPRPRREALEPTEAKPLEVLRYSPFLFGTIGPFPAPRRFRIIDAWKDPT